MSHNFRNKSSTRSQSSRKSRHPQEEKAFLPILIMAPLAAFTAVFLWDGPPSSFAFPSSTPKADDRESANFERCSGPVRINCVVDGDTFWYRGQKIRIADINAPELSSPECSLEAGLAERSTRRLLVLLNAGPFTLRREMFGDDQDQYGRLLRDVTRDGKSVGDTLRAEGLAESWKGYRGNWC